MPSEAEFSAEVERMLDAVPDAINADPVAPGQDGEEDGLGGTPDAPLMAHLGAAIVSEENAATVLRGVGELLASWRDREAYRLAGERAANNCAGALTQVLNRAWFQFAPSFMQSLETNWPGMIPLCAGLAFAFGPAVMEDIRESGGDRKRSFVEDRQSAPAAAPPPASDQPKRNGLIVERAAQ